ncbi:hypothetical protein N9A64_05070 [Pseudomonadales bacterium]|nr:hypothetical protein [Pseudomonadales bacterium]
MAATIAYEHCLVIPARDENWHEIQQVWRNLTARIVVILIVNTSDEDDHETERLLTDSISSHQLSCGNLYLSRLSSSIDCLIVDRVSKNWIFKHTEGVGLARKIGADIALSMISSGLVTNPFINNTDADAQLPSDYFDASQQNTASDKKIAAIVRPFRHVLRSDQALSTGEETSMKDAPYQAQIQAQTQAKVRAQVQAQVRAMLLYEISLYYYVNRLKHANSPYAFHTVGSTITVNAKDYALVRGTPKRLAGEDFYLLNKLAKTGLVLSASSAPIELDARVSHRTPFGTGSSIDRIQCLSNPIEENLYYQPAIFELLKALLARLPLIWDENKVAHTFRHDDLLANWGAETGAFDEIGKQKHRLKSRQVFVKFLRDWFDGFRTLKFVHYMRDKHYPSQPIGWICKQDIDLGVSTVSDTSDLRIILSKLGCPPASVHPEHKITTRK